jgi:hypothetical protein
MQIHATSRARFGPRPALARLRHRAMRWRYRNVPPWQMHLRAAAAYAKAAAGAVEGVEALPPFIADFIRSEATRAAVYALCETAETIACLATGPIVVHPRRYL